MNFAIDTEMFVGVRSIAVRCRAGAGALGDVRAHRVLALLQCDLSEEVGAPPPTAILARARMFAVWRSQMCCSSIVPVCSPSPMELECLTRQANVSIYPDSFESSPPAPYAGSCDTQCLLCILAHIRRRRREAV